MAVPLPLCQDGDVVQIHFEGLHDGQRILSTFTYSVEEIPATPVSYSEVYQSIYDAVYTAIGSLWSFFRQCCTQDYGLRNVRVQTIFPTRIPYIRFPVIDSGTIMEASLPPNCAVSITRRGGVIGPQGAGRLQMPAVPVAAINSGVLAGGGYQANYEALGVELLNPITAVTAEGNVVLAPVLFNPAQDDPPKPASIKYLFDYDLQTTSRTQRTRTVGQGE